MGRRGDQEIRTQEKLTRCPNIDVDRMAIASGVWKLQEKGPFDRNPCSRGFFRHGIEIWHESVTLFDSHDLLVAVPGLGANGLPEALSRGVPCVVVRASEMSEAITPGVTGAVVEDGRAPELAAAIASVLANDHIYRCSFERAPAMTAYFSWERARR